MKSYLIQITGGCIIDVYGPIDPEKLDAEGTKIYLRQDLGQDGLFVLKLKDDGSVEETDSFSPGHCIVCHKPLEKDPEDDLEEAICERCRR